MCRILFVCGLLLSGFNCTEAKEASLRPNIVVILCDDLGYGDAHIFNPRRGKIATPSIDRLAAEGMRFTNAHSPSAVCTPTRYSLLTGRYCWRSRLQSGVLGGTAKPLIAKDRETIASFLRAKGYATECIGKWHLGLEFGSQRFESSIEDGPLQHGFDHFFGISASLDMPPFAWIEDDRFTEPVTTRKRWLREGSAAPGFEAADVLPTLRNKAIEYIQTQAKYRKPFFLYLALASPHTPILPTAEWQGKSGLGAYGDFVMQTDAVVGEVIRAIDDSALRENTVVFFASDNGFAPAASPRFLEARGHYPSADFRGYKSDIWEGGHRIPFIVRWPAIAKAGKVSDRLISLTDIFATIADILNAEFTDDVAEDSVSMLPVLRGESALRTVDIHHSVDGYFAVREGNWKLELCAGSGGWSTPRETAARRDSLPAVQLYDLANDPGELNNLADKQTKVVRRLTRYLEKAIADGRTTPGLPQPNDVEIEIYKRPANAH